MNNYEELADFLKTRRAAILPSQMGIRDTKRRRTPGLKREEVAELAGISITWYTWLEQGRPIHVSPQVIDSLARVLLLSKQEKEHLCLLANQPVTFPEEPQPQNVSPVMQHLLQSLTLSPAMAVDRFWNVIAWNEAARAVICDFEAMNARERNIVWAMFTDERYKKLLENWEEHAKDLVGRFRLVCTPYIEDAWLVRFVSDLREQSREFDLWWQLHEIQSSRDTRKRICHPEAGTLDFEVSNFDSADDSGIRLIVHTPAPETDTGAKMQRLLFAAKPV